MSLFNLFKKSPKREPARDDPFGSPELQKRRHAAAMEFLSILQANFFSPDGKVHAGTALAAAAWLAGTSLYRSLNYKHEPAPGTVVLSKEVNEEGSKLLNLFMYYCQRNGIALKPDQLVLKTPDEHRPQMEILQVQEKFQDQYNAIMKKHGLDYLDGAKAGIIVCSIIFQYQCTRARDIDPTIAAGIVSMGIVTGAKTTPPPLKSESSATPVSGDQGQNNQFADILRSIAQNSIDGSGARLVLGEGMTPMQEALSQGGKYILVHPEVVNQLKQNNIDPFLVYEAAMRIEITSKIPQIDFIGANVDELLQAWSGKPEEQAPIHVRQALWLQKNAGGLGYEKSGNSWKLKQ
ncbi:MAG: hypothetical protein EHM33_15485 [Chloroflexi bacterium]|nr:MAG: hypothetical protein EHM33_15485 [Chloroflexota bacterium]